MRSCLNLSLVKSLSRVSRLNDVDSSRPRLFALVLSKFRVLISIRTEFVRNVPIFIVLWSNLLGNPTTRLINSGDIRVRLPSRLFGRFYKYFMLGIGFKGEFDLRMDENTRDGNSSVFLEILVMINYWHFIGIIPMGDTACHVRLGSSWSSNFSSKVMGKNNNYSLAFESAFQFSYFRELWLF